MRATVVIPTYERPEKLLSTVETVCNQTVDDYEVIVIDDGSTSADQNAALERVDGWSHVQVIRQDNTGPAAARNRGWRTTDADIVLFTDDDCIVPDDWIESLLAAFEPGVGAVGGPLLPDEERRQDSVFAAMHAYRNERIYDQPTEPTIGGKDLPMGGTANIAYRREALVAVDGFDESFPAAAGEDADLQDRVVDAGFEMKFVPVVVEHNDEYTWESFRKRAIRHGSGAYYHHRRHDEPRPPARILLGALAAPLFFPRELLRSRSPTLASLAVVERFLSRYGELRALLRAD